MTTPERAPGPPRPKTTREWFVYLLCPARYEGRACPDHAGTLIAGWLAEYDALAEGGVLEKEWRAP